MQRLFLFSHQPIHVRLLLILSTISSLKVRVYITILNPLHFMKLYLLCQVQTLFHKVEFGYSLLQYIYTIAILILLERLNFVLGHYLKKS